MKKGKVTFKHFIKDNKFELNRYLMYLFNKINLHNLNQFKKRKAKKINRKEIRIMSVRS